MTEVLHSAPHFPSSPSTSDALFLSQTQTYNTNPNPSSPSSSAERERDSRVRGGEGEELKRREKEREELSLLALLVAVFRKSLIACKTDREELCAMEIGWPTNVRHVAHVTFDRFNGFLGLPVEFEPEVPRRAPSASLQLFSSVLRNHAEIKWVVGPMEHAVANVKGSPFHHASVFGVSTESMQLSYDSRGNCVPTILLLMQRRLYTQGGLQAEGIFRINAENSQEEFVRDQLNRGIVPEDIDVHCLAGLIKAWFRELPMGVLDLLSPEQVMQCESEEDCTELVTLLPSTEAALLDWAINLMVDVVQEEQFNKMNAHNIAMVFAPNMTQMADPLTALMYAVQVMNFLKTLIMKTLREREDSWAGPAPASCAGPSDESGHQSPSQPCLEDYFADNNEETDNEDTEQYTTDDEPLADSSHDSIQYDADESDESPFQLVTFKKTRFVNSLRTEFRVRSCNGVTGQSSNLDIRKEPPLTTPGKLVARPTEMAKNMCNLSGISSRMESIEAW